MSVKGAVLTLLCVVVVCNFPSVRMLTAHIGSALLPCRRMRTAHAHVLFILYSKPRTHPRTHTHTEPHATQPNAPSHYCFSSSFYIFSLILSVTVVSALYERFCFHLRVYFSPLSPRSSCFAWCLSQFVLSPFTSHSCSRPTRFTL